MLHRAVRLLSVSALVLGNSASIRAHAAEPPALHWSRGESALGCIDPATLADRVEQLTGATLSRPARAARTIEGSIELVSGGRYRARITLSEPGHAPTGQRVLEQGAKDCRELDGALVFIVAMMVDPNLSLEGLSPELLALVSSEVPAEQHLLAELEQNPPVPHELVANPSAEEVEASEPSEPTPPAPPEARAKELTKLELRVMGVAEFEVAPEPMFGLNAQLGVHVSRYLGLLASVRGAGGFGAMGLSQSPSRFVKAQAFDAAVALCVGLPSESRFRVRGCLGPEYSLWRQKGMGFQQNQSALLSGLGVSLALDLTLRIRERWGVGVIGNVRLNTLDRRFVYDQQTIGYSVPRFSYLFSVGPSYWF
jgi:hypothetical protein